MYFLTKTLHLIPEYGPVNGNIGWFLILPLSLISFFCSILLITSVFKKRSGQINIIELLMAAPMVLLVLYVLILLSLQ
jgi:hypothetical protein